MARNASLRAADKAKNDEFYTRREDIEAELNHYADQFEGKRVYCNCDDPEQSEFWQFFKRMFKPWKLKSLTATHYEPCADNYAYKLELSEDTNGDGVIDWNDEPVITQIECNGDFRNEICIELLKEADIVVTNPPFSLFREYVAQLMEYEKKFVVIGNMNAITYKEIFPLLKDDKVWLGYSHPKQFFVPDDYDAKNVEVVDGRKVAKFGNIEWFTNLDITKRHEFLDLRGNYYDPEKYPTYDNYDAIEVGKVDSIPCDYDGVMGVPITFLGKYCPEQFEIVGFFNNYKPETAGEGFIFGNAVHVTSTKSLFRGPVIDGKAKYFRILIRNRNPEPPRVVK